MKPCHSGSGVSEAEYHCLGYTLQPSALKNIKEVRHYTDWSLSTDCCSISGCVNRKYQARALISDEAALPWTSCFAVTTTQEKGYKDDANRTQLSASRPEELRKKKEKKFLAWNENIPRTDVNSKLVVKGKVRCGISCKFVFANRFDSKPTQK